MLRWGAAALSLVLVGCLGSATAALARGPQIRAPAPEVSAGPWINWERYGVRGWPTTVLVDRHRILQYRRIGEGAYRETAAVIRRLLGEKAQ